MVLDELDQTPHRERDQRFLFWYGVSVLLVLSCREKPATAALWVTTATGSGVTAAGDYPAWCNSLERAWVTLKRCCLLLLVVAPTPRHPQVFLPIR